MARLQGYRNRRRLLHWRGPWRHLVGDVSLWVKKRSRQIRAAITRSFVGQLLIGLVGDGAQCGG